MNSALKPSMQRIRAGRSDRCESGNLWQLAWAAHAGRSRQMRATPTGNWPWVVWLALALCGCASTPEEPAWVAKAMQIEVGMPRAEAESHLPSYATVDMSFGSSGIHRDFYAVGEHWRVALVYRAPMETNLFITEISTNGQEVTRGPLNGWAYRPTTNQPVIAGPFITYVKSRGSQFADPFGSFAAKVPIRREQHSVANGSQPFSSTTNVASSTAGSRR